MIDTRTHRNLTLLLVACCTATSCLAAPEERGGAALQRLVCGRRTIDFASLLFDLTIEDRLACASGSTTFQYASNDHRDPQTYWDYLNGDWAWNNAAAWGWHSGGGAYEPYRIVQGWDGRKEYEIVPRTAGPGALTRLWLTHRQHDNAPELGAPDAEWGYLAELGDVRIYFDDESRPRIDLPVTELFGGTRAPFLAPLVGHYRTANGGNVSYVPLPFARSIRVTVAPQEQTDRYVGPRLFQATITRFDPSVPVTTYTAAAAAAAGNTLVWTVRSWRDPGRNPNPGSEVHTTHAIVGDGQVLPLEIVEPGTIREIQVRVPAGREDDVELRVLWDDQTTPAVQGTVQDLFGASDETRPYQSLPVGLRDLGDGRLEGVQRLPMPFERARLELALHGAAADLELSAGVQPGAVAGARRLHAETRVTRHDPGDPNPVVVLDRAGAGRFVGLIFAGYDLDRSGAKADPNTPLSDAWRLPFLESNLDVWVDGGAAPALPGTGLEDDFDAGYYFIWFDPSNPTATQYALSGCLAKDAAADRAAAYRFYLTDSVEYAQSLRVTLQAGVYGNNLAVTYATTAFWYE